MCSKPDIMKQSIRYHHSEDKRGVLDGSGDVSSRAEGVVHDEREVVFVGQGHESFEVRDVASRVADALYIQGLIERERDERGMRNERRERGVEKLTLVLSSMAASKAATSPPGVKSETNLARIPSRGRVT